ncbi:MAG: tetratricopeptide repeat protein [Thiobacillaceae bacterium]
MKTLPLLPLPALSRFMKTVTLDALTVLFLVMLSGALLVPRNLEAGDLAHDISYQQATKTKTTGSFHPDWTGQAITLEHGGNWQALLDLGLQWTRAEPRNASAWFVLGRALGGLKRYAEAIAAYKRNLHIDPRDVYARNNMGNAYRDSKNYLLAMHAYREAVRINPDYIPAWQNLGLTFYQLKGVAGISQGLRQLYTSDPELAAAWYKLAIQYSQSQDPRIAQQAISVLRALPNARQEQMFQVLMTGM